MSDALQRRREASYRMPSLADGRRDPWSDQAGDAPDAEPYDDGGDWDGEDYYAPPWPIERERRTGQPARDLSPDELRQHANRLVRQGWSIADVEQTLGVRSRRAAS